MSAALVEEQPVNENDSSPPAETEETPEPANTSSKKGRGRPKKADIATESVSVPKGRGRPKGAPKNVHREKQEAVEENTASQSSPQKGRGRPKGAKKISKEREVPEGRLRDKPRLSYKDDSDSDIDQFIMDNRRKRKFVGDQEANADLEKKLRKDSPKKRPESLRKKQPLSYKDDSDSGSNLESGFESDTKDEIVTAATVKPNRGRGHPKKITSQKQGRGRPRKTSQKKKKSESSEEEEEEAEEEEEDQTTGTSSSKKKQTKST